MAAARGLALQTDHSQAKYFARKPGVGGPSLGIGASFWALLERPLPVERALEEVCSEGVEYFEAGFTDARLADIRSLLKSFPLQLIGQGWASASTELQYFFHQAIDFRAAALNLHLGHAYMQPAQALDLAGEAQRLSEQYGMPMLLETHRGRMTQDLFRTGELIERMPDLVVTLDLSHYLVAGETLGGSEALFRRHVEPLLARTGLIHGRISNGASVQVQSSAPFAFTELLLELWGGAMHHWLQHAPNDAVFIFEPELGPPPYAYCGSPGAETFSRQDESRILTELGRQAWAKANQWQS